MEAQPAWEHCSALIGTFFFLVFHEGAWIDPLFSLPASLPPFHLTESCEVFFFFCLFIYKFSISAVLSLSNFHKMPWEFSLSRLTNVLHLFSLPLSDLSVGEWQQDSNSGNTSRVLSYTIALNNPLGPKTAPVVETQVSP